MISLITEIEQELRKSTINIIELYDIDMGGGIVWRWSNQDVSSSITPDGIKYDARITSSSTLPFSVGAEEDSASMVGFNGDLFFTNMVSEGLILENARVTIHRLFPALTSPNNIITNYWHGRITSYELTARTCTMDMAFGFVGLNKKALRRWENDCNSLFADDLHCPYDPLTGVGLPENKVNGTATSGTSTTLVDTTKNFTNLGVEIGWYVLNTATNATGIITIVGTTSVTVDSWRNGNAPSSGNAYVIGPQFKTCTFSKSACISRGMFGPNDKQTAAQLNKVTRRYYTGLLQPSTVPYSGKQPSPSGKRIPFYSRVSKANANLAGQVIPVVIGEYHKRDLQILGTTNEGDFLSVLAVVGEGRCHIVSAPGVDGIGPAAVDFSGNAEDQESFMSWGVDFPTTSNDSSDVTAELTLEQQKMAIGSKESRAVRRRENVDTYKNNPELFNNANGDGISPAGLCMIRVRTQPQGGVTGETLSPSVDAYVLGLAIMMPPSSTAQEDDLRVTDWTFHPNPIQVAYYFLRNTRWGAGIDDGDIDLASVRAESDYCQEFISSTQSQFSKFTGTVGFGPSDVTRSGVRENWIWIEVDLLAHNLMGGIYKTTQSGKQFSSTITKVDVIPYLPDEYWDEEGEYEVPSESVGNEGAFIQLKDDFPSGDIPTPGDTFEITPSFQVKRFDADGELNEDVDVKEMLQSILDNCAGTFIQDQGKISFIIRKQVNLEQVLDRFPVFTDKGNARNVIHDGGSTMKFIPDPITESPNSISVEFSDQTVDFQNRTLVMRGQVEQEHLGKIFGEKRRDKREEALSLNLTTHRDQAIRLAVLILREKGRIAGNVSNGIIEWVSPIHDAIGLQPIKDVVPVASDHIPRYIQFVRIMEIEDNLDKMTMTIRARPYFDYMYDDTAEDKGIDDIPKKTPRGGDPTRLIIESVTESVIRNLQGNVEVFAEVKFTLPI